MFERPFTRRLVPAVIGGVLLAAAMWPVGPVQGQDAPKKSAGVNVSFLPPPLEGATYSVGIYEAKSGKLVRRLCEAAPQSAFTVGLNGLVTSWDGKDDNGKTVPSGRYAARGYAVGPMKVEGVAIRGNDWATEDENLRIERIHTIGFVPEDDGLIIEAKLTGGDESLLRFSGKDGALVWRKELRLIPSNTHGRRGGMITVTGGDVMFRYGGYTGKNRVTDGTEMSFGEDSQTLEEADRLAAAKGGTFWYASVYDGLVQLDGNGLESGKLPDVTKLDKIVLRRLPPDPEKWRPLMVASSIVKDKFYVLEDNGPAERIRGLEWVETKQEGGKPVSTWQTFFERSIDHVGASEAIMGPSPSVVASSVVEVTLAENPLSFAKPERVKLGATFDGKGSYLATSDGLRLRQISERTYIDAVKLVKDKSANALTFYQSDVAAWDEFSIKGAKDIAGFDAGEFEITGAGVEKTNDAKAPEPDL